MKVVLAAAMWNSPHMLVLDEPTNYLDRESLGALAAAIKTYGGGVVMISHHSGEKSSACLHISEPGTSHLLQPLFYNIEPSRNAAFHAAAV